MAQVTASRSEPGPHRTIAAALDDRAALMPDKIAFWWDDIPETFGQFRRRVRSVGAGLGRHGLAAGDRFAIYLANCPELPQAWIGGLYVGIQPVAINVAYIGEFLRHQLADSGSRLIVTSAELVAVVIEVLPGCPAVDALVVLGDEMTIAGVVAPVPVVAWTDFCRGDLVGEHALVTVADRGAVVYTSGTTGPSKGVMLSQGHLAGVARSNCEQVGLTADDVTHIPVPLFHVSGMNGVLHAVWAGCSTIFERRFSADVVLKRLSDYQVTVLTVVGPILQMLWNRPPAEVEKHLTLRALFGNPILVPFEDLRKRYGIEYVATAYGQSEVQPCIVGRLPDIPYGAAGRLHPNLDARLVDDDGRDVPAGTPGELLLRPRVPYAMFDGYVSNPEADEKEFIDGWYHTGDVLRRDQAGIYYWLDRKRDVVRRRGENISSVEVEAVIQAHPHVAEAALHGVPSELGEEEVKVVVVLADGCTLTHRQLHDFCLGRVPRFAVPRYIEFVDALPRNPIGRVQKFQLRRIGITDRTWDRQADADPAE
jgi:crotonobetaine/carnitine-CoA ligase